MANYIVSDTELTATAEAVRQKGGTSALIPWQAGTGFKTAIDAIPSGGITPTGTKQISITQNGTTTEDVTQYANAKITVNVPSGPSLPSVISKIDGGSFTPSSDLQSSALTISHNLGVAPKGFVIWTEDELSGTIATRYAAQFFLSASDVHRSNGNIYAAIGGATILYNGNTSFANATAKDDQIDSFMTASTIGWNNTLIYCKAGLTYKWLAWA